jgi:hypothetical protein
MFSVCQLKHLCSCLPTSQSSIGRGRVRHTQNTSPDLRSNGSSSSRLGVAVPIPGNAGLLLLFVVVLSCEAHRLASRSSQHRPAPSPSLHWRPMLPVNSLAGIAQCCLVRRHTSMATTICHRSGDPVYHLRGQANGM